MNKNKGFTLLELLMVIAIIGVLAAIVMAMLGSSKNKGNDAKVTAHLKSMVSQAQIYTGPTAAVVATTTAPVGDATGTRNLFTSSTAAENSLFRLANALPSGTFVYYASNATSPLAGGLWAFAASTSVGSFCVDYTGVGKANTAGTSMTTLALAQAQWPNLPANTYSCN